MAAALSPEQQQAVVQMRQQVQQEAQRELMQKVSEKCFAKCVIAAKMSSQNLEKPEQACIAMCMDRYMETQQTVTQVLMARQSR